MFRAAAESTNLYGSESWTLTSEIYKKLGVVYTTFPKPILRISWWDRRANKGLYVNPKLTDTIKQQRMSFAGHCWRSKELAHDLIFWEPSHGKRRKERPAETFIRQLEEKIHQGTDVILQSWLKIVLIGKYFSCLAEWITNKKVSNNKPFQRLLCDTPCKLYSKNGKLHEHMGGLNILKETFLSRATHLKEIWSPWKGNLIFPHSTCKSLKCEKEFNQSR